jgi:CBS domain containing-hemolysin-like protein
VLAAALLARVTGVDQAGFPLLVLSILAFVLFCEHVIPLIIVRRDPERVLDVLLPSFDVILGAVRPLTAGMLRLGTNGQRRNQSGVRKSQSTIRKAANGKGEPEPPPAEPAPPLPAPEVESVQEGQARELLRTLADFRETMVREVMTPRPDIAAIDSTATIDQLYSLFREQGYSRVPVFKDTLDNVVGFAFIKDLIQRGPAGGSGGPITPLVRPAHFVPETKRVPDLLKEFQRRRLQIAIVVDEYGGTAGLVTVEDLLEEIVGEIRDEYDVEVERIVDEGNGTFLLSGSVHVDEMANLMKLNVDGHGFETVGGFLLSKLGRVPNVGEHMEVDGLDVEIVDTQQRRITRVRMSRLLPVPAAESQPTE